FKRLWHCTVERFSFSAASVGVSVPVSARRIVSYRAAMSSGIFGCVVYIAHLGSSIALRLGAGQFPRPAQRVLRSLDEIGGVAAWLAFLSLEGSESLLPALAELGRPSPLFIGPGRSTLRVIDSSLSNRRLSASSSFTFSSSCKSRVVVSGGLPGDAPGSIAVRIAFSALSSNW